MAEDTDLIDRLASAVAERIRPQIPFDYEMWDIARIAARMKLSEAHIHERPASQPNFPKRCACRQPAVAEDMHGTARRTHGRG